MNMRIITIGIIFFLLTACQESQNQKVESNSELESPANNFVKTFEGEIDNKYPILAKIKANDGKIEGNYYYTKVGQELDLQGTISGKGKVIFEEFDKNGNKTGQFEGIFKESKIEGNWSNPNNEKNMPFEMIESNTNYLSSKNELQELKGISGRYESPFNEGGISSGTIIINHKKGQTFTFEISVANAKGCTGDLKGNVNIGTDKSGVFTSNTCENLKFEFFTQELKIQEKNCDEHGMNCWFSGTYKKKI